MKKLTAVLVAAALSLAVAPVAHAAKSDYSKAKQNQFWRVVSSYDPMVKLVGKKSTVELGIATCDLLRAGGDLYDLSYLLLDADAGIAEDSIMAVMAAAPVVLCRDQAYKFE